MKCCPTCGQTLPEKIDPLLTLFQGKRREMLRIIQRAGPNGLSTEEIFDHIYAQDTDGGPDTGYKIIAVFAWHINRLLRPQGYRVYSKHRGRSVPGRYVLTKI